MRSLLRLRKKKLDIINYFLLFALLRYKINILLVALNKFITNYYSLDKYNILAIIDIKATGYIFK